MFSKYSNWLSVIDSKILKIFSLDMKNHSCLDNNYLPQLVNRASPTHFPIIVCDHSWGLKVRRKTNDISSKRVHWQWFLFPSPGIFLSRWINLLREWARPGGRATKQVLVGGGCQVLSSLPVYLRLLTPQLKTGGHLILFAWLVV